MVETKALQSQTAIVTGGSRGLGCGIAEALAARKMRVVVLSRRCCLPERNRQRTRSGARIWCRFRSMSQNC
jgi:NAD(P)-dependent dehydrogenase (short-subunit alcohol dehydrogenase family)